jgi:hypothetical protein
MPDLGKEGISPKYQVEEAQWRKCRIAGVSREMSFPELRAGLG